MFSEAVRAKLTGGKYTRWALTLDDESMEALLWAIGEFACRDESVRRVLEHYQSTLDTENDVSTVPFLRAFVGLKATADIANGRMMKVDEVQNRIYEAVAHLRNRNSPQ